MLTRTLPKEGSSILLRRIRAKPTLLSRPGLTYSRNSRSASKTLHASGPQSVETKRRFPLALKIGLLRERPPKSQSRSIPELSMEFQDDYHISRLQQGKAKPPECWKVGKKELNGDTG